jgi:hypothetical protein
MLLRRNCGEYYSIIIKRNKLYTFNKLTLSELKRYFPDRYNKYSYANREHNKTQPIWKFKDEAIYLYNYYCRDHKMKDKIEMISFSNEILCKKMMKTLYHYESIKSIYKDYETCKNYEVFKRYFIWKLKNLLESDDIDYDTWKKIFNKWGKYL